ncbi:MAG: transposase [Planctomycetes bacterium]|nr:transposase [Planctomycetota bacterium]
MRRGRRLHGGQGNVADNDGSNRVWCIDYKGQFRLGDGQKCYPLTVTDGHSRMVLCCQGHPGPRDADARSTLESVFEEYGLPHAIRSDNGTPFASIGAGRLTALSVCGHRVPAHYAGQAAGGWPTRGHAPNSEAETANPPARKLQRQQRRFEQWTEEFNFERPHQALDGSTPASAYELSEHAYSGEVGDPEYPGHYETPRVGSDGLMKFRLVTVYLSQALSNELVGLVEVADGKWRVKFAGVELASCNERTKEMKQIGGSARASSKGKKYKQRVSPMRPV